ncbi:MAG TPA: RNA polymerase sigma factor [Jatrophihabitans sp.]|nr:RNA polymerase sigma factor [Jatrophihabitans sp.]
MTGVDAALPPVTIRRPRPRPTRPRPTVWPTDAELTDDLASAKIGDEAAFGRVYRAVQPGLRRYLTALVGADADDIAAETWAQAVRGFDKFRGDIDGFRGWMARIGRHRAIDHLRATARRPIAAATDEVLVDWAAQADTEAAVIEGISTQRALALIARLPADQAEAVLLRAVMGLDAAAAGAVLGKRPGAVRMAAHRGLRALAAGLADGVDARQRDVSALAIGDEVR